MARMDAGRVGPGALRLIAELGREIAGFFAKAAVAGLLLFGLIVAAYYPRDTDEPLSEAEKARLIRYYVQAYEKPVESKEDPRYVQIAEAAAKHYRIREAVAEFVAEYDLADKRVLDVGAGRCYLQDIVEDYTALDIAVMARRYCRKRFVLGSATAMPFGDNEFDAAWSIWVLEHVPNPEQALSEIRRVVKPGGLVYLRSAWMCTPFAAQPDSDAVNSLDPFEVGLWFQSRGDLCLNCAQGAAAYFQFPDVLILRIQKPSQAGA